MRLVPSVLTVLANDPFTRDLLDREIMLTCLAEAADTAGESDLLAGRPARQVLEINLRAAQLRRRAAVQRATASGLRRGTTPSAALSPAAMASAAAMVRMMLDVRRGHLEMHRLEAADLRASARALRAEAVQIRLRGRRGRG